MKPLWGFKWPTHHILGLISWKSIYKVGEKATQSHQLFVSSHKEVHGLRSQDHDLARWPGAAIQEGPGTRGQVAGARGSTQTDTALAPIPPF